MRPALVSVSLPSPVPVLIPDVAPPSFPLPPASPPRQAEAPPSPPRSGPRTKPERSFVDVMECLF
ncbi:hypothetical protein [Stigmatella erecta]|uniref:Uncharacterized protein n=1 Tax=Stigmatella erecta TaxID=83460 RepID=A0A1I0KYX7_9BACT|nr:hypothetical protein [Stigmatella erecta]SEU31854.1 hypothetical protein SAMN05443639_116112 [Stigmatella erecta]